MKPPTAPFVSLRAWFAAKRRARLRRLKAQVRKEQSLTRLRRFIARGVACETIQRVK